MSEKTNRSLSLADLGRRAHKLPQEGTQIFSEATTLLPIKCSREESNLHGSPHTVLSRTRLPFRHVSDEMVDMMLALGFVKAQRRYSLRADRPIDGKQSLDKHVPADSGVKKVKRV